MDILENQPIHKPLTPISDITTPAVFEILHATSQQLESMGGKASTLAKLLQLSFPVPPGLSVLKAKLNESELRFVQQWVDDNQVFPVAVRSSAQGEDGSEVSYAGQFKTFLNITAHPNLVQAINDCFASVERASSNSYAQHFGREQIPMRVLIQKMIQPQFSGVYFSRDPRNESAGWMIEAVAGLGEQLVSGQVTPNRYCEDGTSSTPIAGWKPPFAQLISNWAQRVELALNYKIDMEWAIDKDDNFWILQVRPITTTLSDNSLKTTVSKELARINSKFSKDTIWDGHSFAELSGVPSEFTFNLWREAFLPGRAFDLALKILGYHGLDSASIDRTNNISLLDRVFGRSYLNLKNMEPIYFGRSPYKIVPNPRPHLKFDFRKLNISMLLRAPQGIWQMITVAWKIQTERKELAERAKACLADGRYNKLSPHEIYAQSLARSPELQLVHLKTVVSEFTKNHLQGTFLITLLIESTTQGIMALLSKDIGAKRALEESHHFLGENLVTMTSKMSTDLIGAHDSLENWNGFVSRFGHRGLGELELSRPRWIETKAPIRTSPEVQRKTKVIDLVAGRNHFTQLLTEISGLRRPLFVQELKELQNLLRIREEIKMHVMKPYADIRWSLISLAKNMGLTEEDIFWLSLPEITALAGQKEEVARAELLGTLLVAVKERRDTAKVFKSVEIPMSFSAGELAELLDKKPAGFSQQVVGVSLSPGMASGIVHIVESPETEDLDSWPENTILVAETTDPGWTPLFEKSKAIIVSRGGVLSHCAIVAREMGLPAVGEIVGAGTLFKEGEHVWVDGIHGTVRRAT